MTDSAVHPDLVLARTALAGVVRPRDLADGDAVALRYSRAVWSCLVEPGDGIAGRIVATLGPVAALQVATGRGAVAGVAARADLSSKDLARGRARWKPRLNDIVLPFEIARRRGIRMLVPEDPEWPVALSDLGDHAPLCLWFRGDPNRLSRAASSVALVGARAATGYGEHVAGELAAELASDGIAVVSGAAYGIDGMAHRAALSAGGDTIALLAGGVDRPYPSGHDQLLGRIATEGVVASEVPCGSTPTKWRFLARNRLIAALAQATVVVEAGWRSGSLNTAGHAAALGRPLGAVPGPITSAASAGCHRLLREFDARCITGSDDVRELLGLEVFTSASSDGGSPDRTRVLDALSSRSVRDTADIARRSGMAVDEAGGVLALLALSGDVQGDRSGWRRAR